MTAPDILSPEFAADPYPIYAELRDNHPLHYHEGMQSYVLSRYADCAGVFKNPAFTSENYAWQLEPVHGKTILQMEGTEHARNRSLLNPFFRGKGLDRFMGVIHQNATELIETFAGKSAGELIDSFAVEDEVDLVDRFTTRFPINVIVDMLGLPKADHDQFHTWYSSIMGFLSNLTQDPDVAAAGLQTKEDLEAYMLPIIRDRRENPGEDLLSRLCQAEVDGQAMTDLEIKAFVSLLLTAGGETTDKAVASAVKNLLEHPAQMADVRADRMLVLNTIAETLRYSPPVHMIMRETNADVAMHDMVIPSGSTVIVLLGAANRDERQYQNPDTFDIHRDDLDVDKAFSAAANHLAFILGRHFCVGSLLAKTEMEIALNMLFDRLPDIQLAEGHTPGEVGVFTRAPDELRVTFSTN